MFLCAVPGCSTSRYHNPQNYTFHMIPHEMNIRQKWLENINRPNWVPTRTSMICSKHFKPNCFTNQNNQRVTLRFGAIPTLFVPLPVKMPPQRISLQSLQTGDKLQECFDCIAKPNRQRKSKRKKKCPKKVMTRDPASESRSRLVVKLEKLENVLTELKQLHPEIYINVGNMNIGRNIRATREDVPNGSNQETETTQTEESHLRILESSIKSLHPSDYDIKTEECSPDNVWEVCPHRLGANILCEVKEEAHENDIQSSFDAIPHPGYDDQLQVDPLSTVKSEIKEETNDDGITPQDIIYDLSHDHDYLPPPRDELNEYTHRHTTPQHTDPLDTIQQHTVPLHTVSKCMVLLHTAPQRMVPLHTAPQRMFPLHTAPQHTVPLHTAAKYTVPLHTAPKHTVPLHTAAKHTVPLHIAPQRTVPLHTTQERMLPLHTAPQHTVPLHTAPQHMVPLHTVPLHTAPQHTVPLHTAPQHTVPLHAAPQHTVPLHTAPQHMVPLHTVPLHTAPQHTVPLHTAPQHAVPLNKAPVHTKSVQTIPVQPCACLALTNVNDLKEELEKWKKNTSILKVEKEMNLAQIEQLKKNNVTLQQTISQLLDKKDKEQPISEKSFKIQAIKKYKISEYVSIFSSASQFLAKR